MKRFNRLILLIVIAVGAALMLPRQTPVVPDNKPQTVDARLLQAYNELESDLQIEGSARIKKLLPDDLKGSRHQRFIIELSHGQTILIAHNIDLAPRVPDLKVGDSIRFYGEYEWNNQGGVIHWTHKDPQGKHPHGWLEYNGLRYW